jgi:hypothetical protein
MCSISYAACKSRIVSEFAVPLYDLERAVIFERFEAQDVLGASWREGDRLHVESASGAPLVFMPQPKIRLSRSILS